MTGGNLTGATATNCRVAIAREMNRSISDVAIFDVVESKAGNVAHSAQSLAWIEVADDGNVIATAYPAPFTLQLDIESLPPTLGTGPFFLTRAFRSAD